MVAARRVLTPGSYTMAPPSEDDDFDNGKKAKNFSFIVSWVNTNFPTKKIIWLKFPINNNTYFNKVLGFVF